MIDLEKLENKFLVVYDNTYRQNERVLFYGFVYNLRLSNADNKLFFEGVYFKGNRLKTRTNWMYISSFEEEPRRWFAHTLLKNKKDFINGIFTTQLEE